MQVEYISNHAYNAMCLENVCTIYNAKSPTSLLTVPLLETIIKSGGYIELGKLSDKIEYVKVILILDFNNGSVHVMSHDSKGEFYKGYLQYRQLPYSHNVVLCQVKVPKKVLSSIKYTDIPYEEYERLCGNQPRLTDVYWNRLTLDKYSCSKDGECTCVIITVVNVIIILGQPVPTMSVVMSLLNPKANKGSILESILKVARTEYDVDYVRFIANPLICNENETELNMNLTRTQDIDIFFTL